MPKAGWKTTETDKEILHLIQTVVWLKFIKLLIAENICNHKLDEYLKTDSFMFLFSKVFFSAVH